MEHSLLLMLIAATILITLLSFKQNKVIALRFISGMFLVGTALVVIMPVMFVGFGSQNVITYTGSAAGDPGRGGELEVLSLGFGLIGAFQFVYALILIIELSFMKPAQGSLPGSNAEGYI